MANELTILIADDHPVFRQGLRMVIERERGFRVLDEAEDGRAALEKIIALKPQVAVVDGSIGIPGTQGYLFATARTRKFTIGPESFVPTSSAWSARIDEGFNSSLPDGGYSLWASGGTAGNPAYFVAPVLLPDGALITGFSGRLIKNGGSLQSVIQLLRAAGDCYINCSPDLIATATTTTSGGIVATVQAATINASFNSVDNSTYHYFVRFTGEQNTQNLRLNLVQVTYQVSKVD